MGGLFGAVSQKDCVTDVYFGTDYHSHLGTRRGGMAIWNGSMFNRAIHNIENIQFRAKFESELAGLHGQMGIGCISDTDPQPLTVQSHLGRYAICTVGKITNSESLIEEAFSRPNVHFLETNKGKINSTELVSVMIESSDSFKDGILTVQERIEGSCSMLLLTPDGIYAARDKFGRTPLVIGRKSDGYCISSESCTFANLGYEHDYELGPGEVVLLTPDEIKTIVPRRNEMKICAFLWVYYGYPSSSYEGVSVELMRYRNGANMAKREKLDIDLVAGVPDSGIGHAIGYSNASHIPFGRPFIKYTPTWSRSFMPQDQKVRNLVARMKLMPIPELVANKRLLMCDDSVVRGTQMRETADLLYGCNAKEVHLRSACPPILFDCKYLNFSASRSIMDLVARQAISAIEGYAPENIDEYCDPTTEKYRLMTEWVGKHLNLSTFKYQNIHDMLDAIGIEPCKVCTYCWTGKE